MFVALLYLYQCAICVNDSLQATEYSQSVVGSICSWWAKNVFMSCSESEIHGGGRKFFFCCLALCVYTSVLSVFVALLYVYIPV